MDALNWLGQIGEAILSLLPRRIIIPTTEAAVIWRRGKYPKLLKPGWHVYWPLMSTVKTCKTAIRSLGLIKQTVTTNDNRIIGASGWLTYKVADPLKLLCQYDDHEDALQETAAAILAEVVCESEIDNMNTLSIKLKSRLEDEFKDSGLVILKFALSDYMPANYPVILWQPD